VLTTPSVRRLAREHGIDLGSGVVAASGRDGRLLKGDVLEYIKWKAQGGSASVPAPVPPQSSSSAASAAVASLPAAASAAASSAAASPTTRLAPLLADVAVPVRGTLYCMHGASLLVSLFVAVAVPGIGAGWALFETEHCSMMIVCAVRWFVLCLF
jgi:hypothetical protein